MAAFGRIEEYSSDTDWSEYIERLDCYFTANDITDNEKKKAILLTVCGSKIYSLVKSLLAPAKPTEKPYKDICDLVKSHLNPAPLIIAERYKFHLARQTEGQSISSFMAELRKLSEHCDFGEFLDDALRDRFVCGLHSQPTQRKLLTEETLTLKKALEIALSMEAADKQANQFKSITASNISKIGVLKSKHHQDNSRSSFPECYRCGKTNHRHDSCFYKDAKCYKCQKTGHLSRKCPQNTEKSRKYDSKVHKKKPKAAKVKYMEETDSEIENSEQESANDAYDESAASMSCYTLKTVRSKNHAEIMVPVEINDVPITMELDTGCSMSVIPVDLYKKKLSNLPLKKSDVTLKTFTGENVNIQGKLDVPVKYKDKTAKLPLYVVEGPALLGRNWLSTFQLDWSKIFAIETVKMPENNPVEKMMSQYSVFDDKLGTVIGVKASLKTKPDTIPKFFKYRSVPYALKSQIGDELKRLEQLGIIEKVDYSEWAAPVVPVRKPDGSIRLCGDYKITINRDLEVPQYPLPKPDDLFNQLNGGVKFTKLDLSQAYQQVLLDEKSREFVTVNTHLGLYRYRRLPYGIASAPAVFQQLMDKLLQGLSVGCYLDDIIVTGRDDAEHLENLNAVLKRLDQYGIKLRKSKCSFLQPSVQYLGFKIDANGLHPTPDKVEAIMNAPAPKNIKQLQSFLGLINYYRRFIPNMSSLTAPLNNLLGKNTPWIWSRKCQEAFKTLKQILTSTEVLAHYDLNKEVTLAVDASAFGLGAVISHIMENGDEKPVAYGSRTLTAAEKNYSQIEKEALAIIFGLQKFHQYLYGRNFTLITDHKPLTTILGPKTGIPVLATSRLQRWAIQLSAYDYDIKYKSSEKTL